MHHTGTSPLPREGHSTTMVSGNEMFVFGGSTEDTMLNDAFIFDLDHMHWYKVSDENEEAPAKRQGHTAVPV